MRSEGRGSSATEAERRATSELAERRATTEPSDERRASRAPSDDRAERRAACSPSSERRGRRATSDKRAELLATSDGESVASINVTRETDTWLQDNAKPLCARLSFMLGSVQPRTHSTLEVTY